MKISLTEKELKNYIREAVAETVKFDDDDYDYEYRSSDGRGIGKRPLTNWEKSERKNAKKNTQRHIRNSKDGKYKYVNDYEYSDEYNNPVQGSRKTRKFRINEGHWNSDVYNEFDELREMLGDENIINELYNWLSGDEIESFIANIKRMYDLDNSNDDQC